MKNPEKPQPLETLGQRINRAKEINRLYCLLVKGTVIFILIESILAAILIFILVTHIL